MLAGWELPLAAAPAEDWAAMVSADVPLVPVFMTTLAVGAGAWTADLGAGASKRGFKMGAGSVFLTGGAGAGLAAALGFTSAGFFTGSGFFLVTDGFLDAAGFLAGAFLGAGFLAIVDCESELFRFARG